MWRNLLFKSGTILLLTVFLSGTAGMNLLWHHCNASKKDRLEIMVLPGSDRESCCGHACSMKTTDPPPQGLLQKAPCCDEQEYFFKLPEFSSKQIKKLIPEITATLPGPGDLPSKSLCESIQPSHIIPGLINDPPGLVRPDRPLFLLISQIRIPLPENKA